MSDETQTVGSTASNIAPDNSAPIVDTSAIDTPVVDTPVETIPVAVTMISAILTENADGNEIITFTFSDGSTRIINL